MKRGILVYNPTAGQRDRRAAMSALIDRQRARGLELVNAPTSGPGDATAIVKSSTVGWSRISMKNGIWPDCAATARLNVSMP